MRIVPFLTAAAVTAIALAEPAAAQSTDPAMIAAEQAAIAKLDWMNGTWRGPATTQLQTGPHSVTQTERVGNFLNGTVKIVEGRGFNADGSVGFNAFGVISYDPRAKTYAFRSYAQGYAGTFVIAPLPEGQGYVWEIPAGPTTIRYTARIEAGKWHEVGERIMPGQPAVKMFDMVLTQTGTTDWPSAGAQKPQ